MIIGIAQVNPLVGAIEHNKDLILNSIKTAKTELNVDTLIFPELVLTGYPPEDLLYRSQLYTQVTHAIETIISESKNINIILGYPRKEKDNIYNSCAYISNQKLIFSYDKMILPNYGVFDEVRYFSAGNQPCLVDIGNIKTCLTVCEDIWSATPAKLAKDQGAELIININASPFHKDKIKERKNVLQTRNHETGLPIIYVNLIGGQDELVFDGGSLAIDSDGLIKTIAPSFTEGLYTVNLEQDHNKISFTTSNYSIPELSDNEAIYKALVTAIGDYVLKNGFNGVVIGLSGGIDSALVTCLAVDALGAENVEVVMMPSKYTADMSIEDSLALANNLGINYQNISIEKPVSAFMELLDPIFKNLPVDSTEENIQARSRGLILMAISNKSRRLVLATGNKSEMAVGYATLYGDMAGGFSPLKDIPKLLVYELANFINQSDNIIPQRIIDRPPSAELRADQKDEDSLPPYDILDPILEMYIEQDNSPQQIINNGFDEHDVMPVINLVDRTEFKRRQAPPGVKISKRAFGKERRYPITSGYRET
jgi:NAD+ synthase (glutamine-hydrolysing)